MYMVKDHQSKPYYEHQNDVERRIQDVKRMTNSTMDRVGCPSRFWLIATLFVIGLLNVLVNAHGAVPLTIITGQPTDVSSYLSFHFWQEVLYEEVPGGPEKLGRWCGPADSKGDILTYWILTNDTEQLVPRSNVRAAKDPMFPNRRAKPSGTSTAEGEEVRDWPVLSTVSNAMDVDPSAIDLPKFSPEELLGLTFLRDTESGESLRAKVTRKILDRDADNHTNIKFLISCGDDAFEEIIGYNELSDIIEHQHQAEEDWGARYLDLSGDP